jgi:L-ascorbate metabolism protein UlaG (beta-lactamase superfamily)
MRLTKYGHACVRLDKDGTALVIDPGVFSEAEALDGAAAVLVTHEHADHVNVDALRSACAAHPELRVFTNPELAAQWDDLPVTAVAAGDAFDAAGFSIRAYGGMHAEIYNGLPGCANLGYLVDGAVYHPGDSVDVPDAAPAVLLVPVAGPWLKLGEAIDLVRNTKPGLAIPIHDRPLSDLGLAMADNWISGEGGADYRRLATAETLTI